MRLFSLPAHNPSRLHLIRSSFLTSLDKAIDGLL